KANGLRTRLSRGRSDPPSRSAMTGLPALIQVTSTAGVAPILQNGHRARQRGEKDGGLRPLTLAPYSENAAVLRAYKPPFCSERSFIASDRRWLHPAYAADGNRPPEYRARCAHAGPRRNS